MITSAYDPEALVLVSLAAGAGSAEGELELLVGAIERLAEDANRRDGVAIYVIAVDGDQQRPDAGWRRRIATAEQKCRRLRVVLITRSAVIRGVMTAIAWVSPSQGAISRSAYSRLSEAIAALEQELGRSLPQIQRLHDAAQAEITAKLGRPAAAARR